MSKEKAKKESRATALKTILKQAVPRKTSDLSPWEASGLVAVETVEAVRNVPSRPVSNRDGFVLSSKDLAHGKRLLDIHGTIYAQATYDSPLPAGTASRILTGAPLPQGSDVIIPDEAAKTNNGRLIVGKVQPGRFIRAVGSELQKGFEIVGRNEEVSPVSAAMMVMGGVDKVKVYDPPKVKIICLGSELTDPAGPDRDNGSIPADNMVLLTELLRRNGIAGIEPRVCPDNQEAISLEFSNAQDFDIVITAGGTGDSERDYALKAAQDGGFNILFHKVNIRPGSSFIFSVRNKTLHFGLPGPPSAVLTCFHIFILPALLQMRGFANADHFTATGILTRDARLSQGPEWLLYCSMEMMDSTLYVTPLLKEDMNVTKAMLNAQGLMVCPQNLELLPKGSKVEVFLFRPILPSTTCQDNK